MSLPRIEVPEGLIKPTVKLDGDALEVFEAVTIALRSAGNTKDIVISYQRQAMAGDYDNLIAVSSAYTNRPLVDLESLDELMERSGS